ncbi:MAG: hypothetical protein HZA90_23450 [Verrucomicrobia bacterium]|nr:hypothetical protein [Verrucomicrobiota bacterium]
MTTDSLTSLNSGSVVRWIARLLGLASIGILAMFMIGEGYNPFTMKARDAMMTVFFPLGVVFGLILGWRREFLGGLIAVLGLATFYALHFVESGRFPRGWAFLIFASPAFLLLLSAALNRIRRAS